MTSQTMKTLFFFIVVASILISSCQNSDWKTDNSSIRPINGANNNIFASQDFVELNDNQIKDHKFWIEMNHSDFEFGVKVDSGKLIIAEPTFQMPFFELDDGKLEIINRGEFGGALNYIPIKNNLDTIPILEVPINYVFEFKDKIYFVVGIAHMIDNGGAILELIRVGNKFEYKEVIRLDSAPEAMAIYKNKILIASHRMFTVIENFDKENIIEEAFWSGLYPNSIAVKNENEVFIGMRDGYSKLSLVNKKVKYYKYKGR